MPLPEFDADDLDALERILWEPTPPPPARPKYTPPERFMTCKEVAQELGVSVATVQSDERVALGKVRRWLEANGWCEGDV